MGRPVDRAKRRALALAAFEVVKERGVHKITMSHLAKALGIKRPTLYWYFPTLEALFEEVYDGLQHGVITQVTDAMLGAKHPIDQLEACLDAAVNYFKCHRGEVAGLLQLWAVGSAARPAWQDGRSRVLTPQRQFIIKLIEHGIAQGSLRPCDATGLADTLLMLIDGASVHAVLEGADASAMVEFAKKYLLRPLRLPPHP